MKKLIGLLLVRARSRGRPRPGARARRGAPGPRPSESPAVRPATTRRAASPCPGAGARPGSRAAVSAGRRSGASSAGPACASDAATGLAALRRGAREPFPGCSRTPLTASPPVAGARLDDPRPRRACGAKSRARLARARIKLAGGADERLQHPVLVRLAARRALTSTQGLQLPVRSPRRAAAAPGSRA